MVVSSLCDRLVVELPLAAQPVEPVLERLDPPKRTFVIMAIIFIAITGLLLVTCTMLGARWVRGMARQKPRTPRLDTGAQPATENDHPRAALDRTLPQVDRNETIHMDQEKGETRADP
jgi:hypothetical protein